MNHGAHIVGAGAGRTRRAFPPFSRTLAIALVLLGTTATRAPALSEWWTPASATCPSFDSEEACLDYCRQAPESRCGGSVSCTFRTGDQRPEC